MACNDDKEFSIYVENCYLSWKNSLTDAMKLNVHPTNYHTHVHNYVEIEQDYNPEQLCMDCNVYMQSVSRHFKKTTCLSRVLILKRVFDALY